MTEWERVAHAALDALMKRDELADALRALIAHEGEALSGYGDKHPLVLAFSNARAALEDLGEK